MDILNRKLGRRQFITASSVALGAGMLAKPSQLLAAERGGPPGTATGGAPGVTRAAATPAIHLKDEGKYGKYIIIAPKGTKDTGMGNIIFGSGARGLWEDEGWTGGTNFIRFYPPGEYPCHASALRDNYQRHIFAFIGTDPEDPMDLGAKQEYWLGMGENLEKYPSMQQSTAVYVPAGMSRWPWLNHSITRPFTFFQFDIPIIPGSTEQGAAISATGGKGMFGGGGPPGDIPSGAPGSGRGTGQRDMFIATPEEIANDTWSNITKEQKAKQRTSHYIYDYMLRSGVGPEMKKPKGGTWICYLDADIVSEAPLLRFIRYWPEEAPYRVINSQTHEYGTFLVFNGIDNDDVGYLGAEIELCIGPEKEKHTINRSALIYIPADLVHGPFTVKKAEKPFTFVECVTGPEHPGAVYKNVYP